MLVQHKDHDLIAAKRGERLSTAHRAIEDSRTAEPEPPPNHLGQR